MAEEIMEEKEEYFETLQMLLDAIRNNIKEETTKIITEGEIIQIVYDNIKITVEIDGYKHWAVEVIKKEYGEEEELLIEGRGIYYSLKIHTERRDDEVEISYEFDSPYAEDPVETTDIEALIDFIKEVLSEEKSLLQFAVKHLPLDP